MLVDTTLNDYVRRNILRQTDEEIREQDELIEKEIESGLFQIQTSAMDPMGSRWSTSSGPGVGGETFPIHQLTQNHLKPHQVVRSK